MKKYPAFISLMVMCILTVNVSQAGKSGLLGSWKVNASSVPPEYAKSTMVVAGSENAPSVRIILRNGSTLHASNVSIKDDEIRFSINVEGSVVPFTGKITGSKITGTVSTPEGNAGVEAEKLTLKGSWTYKAPDAPWEYSNGRLHFDEAGNKSVAKIIIGGNEIPASNVVMTNETSFSFIVPIENEPVTVKGSIEGDRIIGNASSSQGVVGFSATWD